MFFLKTLKLRIYPNSGAQHLPCNPVAHERPVEVDLSRMVKPQRLARCNLGLMVDIRYDEKIGQPLDTQVYLVKTSDILDTLAWSSLVKVLASLSFFQFLTLALPKNKGGPKYSDLILQKNWCAQQSCGKIQSTFFTIQSYTPWPTNHVLSFQVYDHLHHLARGSPAFINIIGTLTIYQAGWGMYGNVWPLTLIHSAPRLIRWGGVALLVVAVRINERFLKQFRCFGASTSWLPAMLGKGAPRTDW